MESSVKQRLVKFINAKGLTKQRFERLVGLSNGYVANIQKSITHKKLEDISRVFPDLNPAWLLVGEGPMLRTPQDNKVIVDVSTATTPPIIPIAGVEMHRAKKEEPSSQELLLQLVQQNNMILQQYTNLQQQMQQTLDLLARVLNSSAPQSTTTTHPRPSRGNYAAEADEE